MPGGSCSGAVDSTLETSPNVQFGVYVDSAAWGAFGVASRTYITPTQIGPIRFSYQIRSSALFYSQTFDLQVRKQAGPRIPYITSFETMVRVLQNVF
jgi:hypothetical protein